jgi:hypothetical protein
VAGNLKRSLTPRRRSRLYLLQASASSATATNSNPTNRTMMVPIFGGVLRTGIGSAVFGLTVFTDYLPHKFWPRRCGCQIGRGQG